MKRLLMNRPMIREVLDRSDKRSATPLSRGSRRFHFFESHLPSQSAVAAGALPAQSRRTLRRGSPATAFTLTELLVVIAVLALLATTQLPALTRAKSPVKFTQCMNNLRQIGQATMLYRADNNDALPFGNRCRGSGTGVGSVIDPYAWPRQLLRYLGGFKTNTQPLGYLCPGENGTAPGWAFQVHYQANRNLLSDVDDRATPITGATVRTPSMLWMFIEKDPGSFCNIRSGGLDLVRLMWNDPPGSPGLRRHNGGMCSAAADGHVEWLRMPPYQPGRPEPCDLLELGTCISGLNPPAQWQCDRNIKRAKLYSGYCY